jgi:hypothetical protein
MYSDRDEWVEKGKYYYCGDKTEVPPFYCTFGSRHRCLKKGYGAALYKDEPKPAPQMVLCKRGAQKMEKSLNAYQKFIKDHFDDVKRQLDHPTSAQVLKELARRWNIKEDRRREGIPSPPPRRRRSNSSIEEDSEEERPHSPVEDSDSE